MSQQLPGYEQSSAKTPADILLTRKGMIQVPIVVDGNLSCDGSQSTTPYEIRPGWPMGRVTATGRWAPCKRTRANGASGGSSTSITVHDSSAFKVGDNIDIGANSNRAITAINSSTHVITIDGLAITWGDGDLVVARDGSETCRGFLLDYVKLRNHDNTVTVHKSAGLLIQGAVQVTRLRGDLVAIRADSAAPLSGIRFSDEHGQ